MEESSLHVPFLYLQYGETPANSRPIRAPYTDDVMQLSFNFDASKQLVVSHSKGYVKAIVSLTNFPLNIKVRSSQSDLIIQWYTFWSNADSWNHVFLEHIVFHLPSSFFISFKNLLFIHTNSKNQHRFFKLFAIVH